MASSNSTQNRADNRTFIKYIACELKNFPRFKRRTQSETSISSFRPRVVGQIGQSKAEHPEWIMVVTPAWFNETDRKKYVKVRVKLRSSCDVKIKATVNVDFEDERGETTDSQHIRNAVCTVINGQTSYKKSLRLYLEHSEDFVKHAKTLKVVARVEYQIIPSDLTYTVVELKS